MSDLGLREQAEQENPTTENDAGDRPERIAKVLARAGLCSRRDAERWIAEGRVSINGRALASPAGLVGVDSDIRLDGKAIPQADRARVWRYHKPADLGSSHRDEKGRPPAV